MIKGAIFDMDGTLLDSMGIWDNIGEDYLRSLDKEPRENLKETFETFTLEQAAQYLIDKYDVTLSVTEILSDINKIVVNYYATAVTLKPNIKDFLENLKAQNVKMCIATVTNIDLAKLTLTRLGIIDYFSEIFTCASVGHSKEEPVIYRMAMAHLETTKEETVVFEDALYAIKTAKNDGFKTVAVFDKHEEKQDELKKTADFYLCDFSQFEDFWKEINK